MASGSYGVVTDSRMEQVFDAIAAECYKQQIYLHLDNHISKGMWCCGTGDGNSWWGDTYFDAKNWSRGLAYMAAHASSPLPSPFTQSLTN